MSSSVADNSSVSIVANFAALRGKCPVVWQTIPLKKANLSEFSFPTLFYVQKIEP
jgi:hypothetical protein